MFTVIWRSLALYSLLILAVRLMGKRQLGQLEVSEFVVTMFLANLATVPLESAEISIFTGVIPILLVLGTELLIAWLTTRSVLFRRIFCGKPVILIDNGKILMENLRKNRINLDELTMQLREKEIFDLREVKFAILETNGQISALIYAKNRPASAAEAGQKVKDTELPVTLISDGKLLEQNLPLIGKDRHWAEAQLRQRNCSLKEVLLMTSDIKNNIQFIKRESRK